MKMIIKVTTTLFFLFFGKEIVYAGDTIFTSPPDMRGYNEDYMYQVLFDDFSGTSLNTDVWYVQSCMSRGYSGKNESEPYNIEVSDDTLKLRVLYNPGSSSCSGTNISYDYTTAEISSRWNRYKYGIFEANCFVPRGDHYYYSYWLWGNGHPDDGFPADGFTSEIDIIEGCEWSNGTHHKMKSTFHYWIQGGGGEIKLPDDASKDLGISYEGEWHIYKMNWTPFEVTFYIDGSEVWKRTRYYTGYDNESNDVALNEILTNVAYHDRDWFPNDYMGTIFQMHLNKPVPIDNLPTMKVDYVSVKSFFLAPEISGPSLMCTNGSFSIDVDPLASNFSWEVSPSNLVTNSAGTGQVANLTAATGVNGEATITFSFQMPSGETYTKSKSFWSGLKAYFSGPSSILVGGSGTYTATTSCGTSPYYYEWWIREEGTGMGAYVIAAGNPLVLTSVPRSSKALSVEPLVDQSDPMLRQPIDQTHYILYLRVIDANYDTYTTNEWSITAYGDVDLIPISYDKMTNETTLEETNLLISPNPSSGQATITLGNYGSSLTGTIDDNWELEVYNQSHQLKAKQPQILGKSTTLNTSGWKEGVYIVRAKYQDQIMIEKLVIKEQY